MSLIEKLAEIRCDIFLKEFDIDINHFNNDTIVNWKQLK